MRRVAALLALGLLLGAGAGPAHAASLGGFGALPLARPGQTEPSPYFKLRLAPGRSTRVTAVVVNSSPHPMSFAIEPVAGLSGETSGSVYGNAVVAEAHGLRVAPAVDELTLPAHTRRHVAVEVGVAPRAVAGDHLAGLAVVDLDHHTGGGRFRVTEVVRVVLGVSVRVAGSASRHLEIGSPRSVALGGTPDAALQIPLHNTGGLYCRPDLAVRLSGGGRPAVSEVRSLDTILPGTSIDFPLPWRHALAAGTYHAALTATGCGPARHLQRSLVVATARPAAVPGPPAAVPAAVPAGHSSLGWPLLAAVGLGGLLFGVIAARRRRPPAPPAAGQTA